jgi:C4-dicarboxylate-specific signal transduction histidine kinase
MKLNKLKVLRGRRISLAQLISVIFIMAVLTCMSILAATMIYRSSLKIEAHMNSFMSTTAATVEGSLADAIWNIDKDAIEKVVESVLNQQDTPLQALRLYYPNTGENLTRFNRQVEDKNYDHLLESDQAWIENRSIFYNGERVAQMTLVASSENLNRESRQEMMMTCFLFLICFLIMILAVVRILNQILTRPLQDLTRALHQAKYALYGTEINEALIGELGDIASEFNGAIKAISERDKKLQSYATHLEGELAEGALMLEDQKIKAENSARLAALGEISAGVAHEINNPLAIIHASSERLKNAMERKQEPSDSLVQTLFYSEVLRIQKMVDRISKIISGLRLFARDGANDGMKPFILSKMLDEVKGLTGTKLYNRGIQFDIQCEPDLSVWGNEVQISQVLINLINNSVDAIEGQQEKWIHIRTEVRQEEIYVSVTDSGNGIEPAVARKMFQPFFTTKELGKGTGLGLSIAHGIIKSHGGVIELDSRNNNTKIYFTLPKETFKE